MSTIIPQAGNITVILSAELDWRDDEGNFEMHNELKACLAHFVGASKPATMAECSGAYKSCLERSIAVTGPVSRTLEIGYCYAKEFYQECFLAIDHYGHGRLHFIRSGNVETIGQYQACSPGTTDAWTVVLATGECFTFV